MAPTIVYIRHPRARDDGFLAALARRYTVQEAASGKQAIDNAAAAVPDAIVLDAASLRTTGERICRKLKQAMPDTPLIHIHPDHEKVGASPADVIMHKPTPRRLVNSVGRLVTKKDEEVIQCGPFSMNIPRRILIAHGKEIQLTPKQARLVEVFLRSPGETLDRKTLMSKVWETDYMGDTRTLDVHIRWVRRVMENGGSRPRYIKTVRGIGYRLELMPNGDSS
ncbi:MAG: winged helix-turn-helix domain-containing protein [Chloroflexota bacterium]